MWALIISYFLVPLKYQHRVLFWGIFGALVLRAIFIFAGVALIEKFDWILYIFGAFLLYTAAKLVFGNRRGRRSARLASSSSSCTGSCRRPTSSTARSCSPKKNGKRLATPLFAVLVLIEATDVIFAVDSVPAVLAVSHEQFIVFASNAFAILGLRALYFLLADMHARFSYLQQGLAVILAFVGIKMIIAEWYHIPTWASLSFIAIVLAVSIIISLQATKRQERTDTRGSRARTRPVVDRVGTAARRARRDRGVRRRPTGNLTAAWGSRTRHRTAAFDRLHRRRDPAVRRAEARRAATGSACARSTPRRAASFNVREETGRYKCFGCQAAGDVFTFVQEIEHLDFAGAVEHLAAKAGIQLHYTSTGQSKERARRKQLVEAMEQAVEWYHQRLLDDPDARAGP